MYDVERWKKQKKALGLTFTELAERADVSISTLKAIFGGITTDPRIETVKAIDNALGLEEEAVPQPQEKQTEPELQENNENYELLRRVDSLSTPLKSALLTLLRAVNC